ncbi:MAG TPA: hypothetical protein DHV17_02335 [Chitinophagaceae bacterium]|nr:hypothetical protein [Chitinophagaceae bacterium]
MKKLSLLLAFLWAGYTGMAQVEGIELQASGLTCSMCSNAIRKSLTFLDYVDQVRANIRESMFTISFKKDASVNFDELKKKVEDAGFFVASMKVKLRVDHQAIRNDHHVKTAYGTFHFLQVKDQELNGLVTLRLLDKGYVPAKAYKKNAVLTSRACYQTGLAGACCAEDQVEPGSRVYHVTL